MQTKKGTFCFITFVFVVNFTTINKTELQHFQFIGKHKASHQSWAVLEKIKGC